MENFHDIELEKVGERIRNARKKQGLTQTKAAERAFITGQYWSLIESGRERASVNTYRQIAAVLGLTLDDLFYDDATGIRLLKAFSKEGLLADCTALEKAIITEAMLALKNILVKNREL